tara:strand:+ start:13281 stop:13523 length:243 start_codon:yes stop_codon:yes gene_type:complete
MKQELEKRKYAYEMVIGELINFGDFLDHETDQYNILLQATNRYQARLEEVEELLEQVSVVPEPVSPWVGSTTSIFHPTQR